jgi:hypothetical protein
MIRLTVKKEKIKPGDIFEILFGRIGIDPSYKKSKKRKLLLKNILGNRAANQISRMRFSRPFFIF